MPIHNPPTYRYPLFDPWDKEVFEHIRVLASEETYPKLLGSKEDKDTLLVALIRTQKSTHGWRSLLKDTFDQIRQSGTIDTKALHKKYSPNSVGQDTPAWVTYKEDVIVNDFIDSLAHKRVNFVGSDVEIVEFILRFILGQLGSDWELTILMIWELLGDGSILIVSELNEEMRNFDYCGVFR